MADLYEEFQKNGTEIYSVSTDSHFVHKAWYDASDTIKRVKYPMLADPTGQLCRDFGVYIEDEGMALRGSFIINPQGRIVSYEINDNSIGRDAAELLRKVQAAQYVAEHGDQVCPAKWRPGQRPCGPALNWWADSKGHSTTEEQCTLLLCFCVSDLDSAHPNPVH